MKLKMGDLSAETSLETSYGVDKNSFVKMAETQMINLQPVDDEKEAPALTSSDVIEREESDSDDDLVPYDIPNEVPFSEVKNIAANQYYCL